VHEDLFGEGEGEGSAPPPAPEEAVAPPPAEGYVACPWVREVHSHVHRDVTDEWSAHLAWLGVMRASPLVVTVRVAVPVETSLMTLTRPLGRSRTRNRCQAPGERRTQSTVCATPRPATS
jgi:hypothetical protein